MSGKINFSETEVWRDVVLSTYPLRYKPLKIQDFVIHLVGNGALWANSAYITSGGAYDFPKKISLPDFKEPLLIKSGKPLDFSAELQPILVQDYFTYKLNLTGGEQYLWDKKLKSKCRNHIRKAEKSKYRKKIGGLELLDDFYAVISRAWRDLGTPTHSKSFYENIINICDGSRGVSSAFMILYIQGIPAAGACLIYDQDTIYHPYSATLKDFNRYSLNNALYWNIILFAIRKNLHCFDMGRSRKTQGTSKYKLTWGAEEEQLYYYYLNKNSHSNEEDGKVIQFLINAWKKLPLSVANFLGPRLIYKVLK